MRSISGCLGTLQNSDEDEGSDRNRFHWAERVSRRDIQRLYESDAQGMLDQELLDEVHYAIYVRVRDMFDVGR